MGVDPIKDFVKVVAREHHNSGLFLSSSGYASDALSSLTEVERSRVRLGPPRNKSGKLVTQL